MDTTLVLTVLSLCGIGGFSAIILYYISQKFKVFEDPRIDEVERILPGANCGGCGYPGCRGFAEKLVNAESMQGFNCPVGGVETMVKVATLLGRIAEETEPMVAVVRCNGTYAQRPKINTYDGTKKCSVANSFYGGDTGCTYGCLSMGDCVESCKFDAIKISETTGLPEVDEDKCTACGACVIACPKVIIELRKKGMKGRRVFVSCINKDKGAVAMKACKKACIGCKKCETACPFDAITITNNLAYIDYNKCKLCRKCVSVCPTGAILTVNFPAPKPVTVISPEKSEQTADNVVAENPVEQKKVN